MNEVMHVKRDEVITVYIGRLGDEVLHKALAVFNCSSSSCTLNVREKLRRDVEKKEMVINLVWKNTYY